MINFIVSHKIIVVVVALLLAIGVWIGLSSSGSSDSLLSSQTVDDSGPDRELVATLLALRAVKLEGSLFSDPGFQNLKDFSVQIVAEPIGRSNPFAPLGSQASVSPSTTRGAQIFGAPAR